MLPKNGSIAISSAPGDMGPRCCAECRCPRRPPSQPTLRERSSTVPASRPSPATLAAPSLSLLRGRGRLPWPKLNILVDGAEITKSRSFPARGGESVAEVQRMAMLPSFGSIAAVRGSDRLASTPSQSGQRLHENLA